MIREIVAADAKGVSFITRLSLILVGDIVRTEDGKLHEVAAIADGSDAGERGDLLVHSLDGTPNILSPFAVSKVYREMR